MLKKLRAIRKALFQMDRGGRSVQRCRGYF